MKKVISRWAAQYEQESNALILLEEALTRPLLATIPARNVLDLGTGTGRYAIKLAAQGRRSSPLINRRRCWPWPNRPPCKPVYRFSFASSVSISH
ncbi:MAG: hypothetical protein R2867_04450 [Caldilineaceae bacterium]